MTEQNKEITLDEALKRIDQLEAQNAALRGGGKINREAKNSVFLDLFGRKEYLVKLCSLLHPEYGEIKEDELTVVTIENVLTVKHFNDLGVILNKDRRKILIMAEAQSLWSVNVIFRLWEYVVDTLMNYFINNGYDIYGTPKLPMPEVETYIIYTGKSMPRLLLSGNLDKDGQGHQILSLNKEFFGGEKGKPELTSKIIYLENSDGIIEEYIRFSQIFDEQVRKYKDDPEKSYPEIFRICEEEGILTEYLKEHRSEVEKIMMTMVSPEYVKKTTERTAKIRSSIEALREMHHSESEILDYLVTKFGISEEYAKNCLDAEWDEDGVIA